MLKFSSKHLHNGSQIEQLPLAWFSHYTMQYDKWHGEKHLRKDLRRWILSRPLYGDKAPTYKEFMEKDSLTQKESYIDQCDDASKSLNDNTFNLVQNRPHVEGIHYPCFSQGAKTTFPDLPLPTSLVDLLMKQFPNNELEKLLGLALGHLAFRHEYENGTLHINASYKETNGSNSIPLCHLSVPMDIRFFGVAEGVLCTWMGGICMSLSGGILSRAVHAQPPVNPSARSKWDFAHSYQMLPAELANYLVSGLPAQLPPPTPGLYDTLINDTSSVTITVHPLAQERLEAEMSQYEEKAHQSLNTKLKPSNSKKSRNLLPQFNQDFHAVRAMVSYALPDLFLYSSNHSLENRQVIEFLYGKNKQVIRNRVDFEAALEAEPATESALIERLTQVPPFLKTVKLQFEWMTKLFEYRGQTPFYFLSLLIADYQDVIKMYNCTDEKVVKKFQCTPPVDRAGRKEDIARINEFETKAGRMRRKLKLYGSGDHFSSESPAPGLSLITGQSTTDTDMREFLAEKIVWNDMPDSAKQDLLNSYQESDEMVFDEFAPSPFFSFLSGKAALPSSDSEEAALPSSDSGKVIALQSSQQQEEASPSPEEASGHWFFSDGSLYGTSLKYNIHAEVIPHAASHVTPYSEPAFHPTGDHYDVTSCRPGSWYNREGVFCSGNTTDIFISSARPGNPAPVENILVLAACLIRWGGNGLLSASKMAKALVYGQEKKPAPKTYLIADLDLDKAMHYCKVQLDHIADALDQQDDINEDNPGYRDPEADFMREHYETCLEDYKALEQTENKANIARSEIDHLKADLETLYDTVHRDKALLELRQCMPQTIKPPNAAERCQDLPIGYKPGPWMTLFADNPCHRANNCLPRPQPNAVALRAR